jgi:type I restriction enzyme S subunit
MADNWTEKTLDQLGPIVTGKTPPSSRVGNFGGEIPFVTPTDMDGRRIIEKTGRSLSEAGAELVASSRIPRGAVMVSCIGSDMGKTAIAGAACITNQQINSIIVASDDDPLFVYYNLSTRKRELRTAASGSAQPILNKSSFGRFDIRLPAPTEQQAISSVLGTLDDKIELNRRVNETLEAMARALFQSWFVDFDPVRDKAGGRDHDLPAEIADLFPSSFEDSELGDIPRGWEATTWGSLVTLEYGKSLGDYRSNAGEFPVYGTNGKIGTWSNPLCPYPGIIIGRKGAYRGIHYSDRPFFAIDTAFYVVPKRQTDLRWASYSLRRYDINRMDSGSAIPSTSREDFYSMRVVSPPEDLQRAFSGMLKPLWDRQVVNQQNSDTLAEVRETLLPQLISGQLRLDQPLRPNWSVAETCNAR